MTSSVGQSFTSPAMLYTPIYSTSQNITASPQIFGEFFPNFQVQLDNSMQVTIGTLDHKGFKTTQAGYLYSEDGILSREIPSKTLPVPYSSSISYGLYFELKYENNYLVPGGDDGSYFSIKNLAVNPGHYVNGHYVQIIACFYPDTNQRMKMSFARIPGSIVMRDMWISF